MHLLLDLIPQNLPADGTQAVPDSLRKRAAALFRSYSADRTTYARSALKIAQVLLFGPQLQTVSACHSTYAFRGVCKSS